MTVEQLIQRLQEFTPNTRVFVTTDGFLKAEVTKVIQFCDTYIQLNGPETEHGVILHYDQ